MLRHKPNDLTPEEFERYEKIIDSCRFIPPERDATTPLIWGGAALAGVVFFTLLTLV